MSEAHDLDALADALSPAQRRWVLQGEPINRKGFWPVHNAMRGKGLLDAYGNLSAVGLALRHRLKEKP